MSVSAWKAHFDVFRSDFERRLLFLCDLTDKVDSEGKVAILHFLFLGLETISVFYGINVNDKL